MEVNKVEKILLSDVSFMQKNILMMIYTLSEKKERVTTGRISKCLNINYTNCASNLRTLMYADILISTGIGGRAGKEYSINWEGLK